MRDLVRTRAAIDDILEADCITFNNGYFYFNRAAVNQLIEQTERHIAAHGGTPEDAGIDRLRWNNNNPDILMVESCEGYDEDPIEPSTHPDLPSDELFWCVGGDWCWSDLRE